MCVYTYIHTSIYIYIYIRHDGAAGVRRPAGTREADGDLQPREHEQEKLQLPDQVPQRAAPEAQDHHGLREGTPQYHIVGYIICYIIFYYIILHYIILCIILYYIIYYIIYYVLCIIYYITIIIIIIIIDVCVYIYIYSIILYHSIL